VSLRDWFVKNCSKCSPLAAASIDADMYGPEAGEHPLPLEVWKESSALLAAELTDEEWAVLASATRSATNVRVNLQMTNPRPSPIDRIDETDREAYEALRDNSEAAVKVLSAFLERTRPRAHRRRQK
jgi:hypothetical protein